MAMRNSAKIPKRNVIVSVASLRRSKNKQTLAYVRCEKDTLKQPLIECYPQSLSLRAACPRTPILEADRTFGREHCVVGLRVEH